MRRVPRWVRLVALSPLPASADADPTPFVTATLTAGGCHLPRDRHLHLREDPEEARVAEHRRQEFLEEAAPPLPERGRHAR
jgi:hypothetical protein